MTRSSFVLFAAACVSLAGCGDDSGSDDDGEAADAAVIVTTDAPPPDAPPPDAFVCSAPRMMCGADCVDTASDHDNCGECDEACSPAASCQTSECACPEGWVADPLSFLFDLMDTENFAPATAGVGIFMGGGVTNLFSVAFDPATVQVGVDIDLATITPGDPPFVVLGYDGDFFSNPPAIRALFGGISGTLRFERACDVGVAGTIENVMFAEITQSGLVPDGCSLTIAGPLAFDIGEPCDAETDAGAM